jgi:NADP-dependent 3-hydroxy acid dehydrogenase YdfG
MIVLLAGATVWPGDDVARKFAQNGHKVIAIGRECERLEELAAEYAANVICIALKDMTSRDAIGNALAALPGDWRDIDVLINNATLSLGSRLAQCALLENWDDMIDANCKALVAMTRVVLPGMLARDAGTIVNLSAAREQHPSQGSNVFGATVAFVHQYTLDLIESVVDTRIRATCIAPQLKGGAEFLQLSAPDIHVLPGKASETAYIPTAVDIAEMIYWVATAPAHVDINRIELTRAGGPFSSHMGRPA